ncbi:MAG: tyrosine-type recombinase/integrase [Thermodesulfobacteriota bacterium]
MGAERQKTKYPGVFYRESKRIGGKGTERIYYVVYKQAGKVVEAKAGRQFADDMTPARAAAMRADLIEGKRLTKADQRREEATRWTVARLWDFFKEHRGAIKSARDDRYRYEKHIKPALASKDVKELITLDIDRLKRRLAKEELSPATQKHVLTLLRRMLRLGAQKGLFPMPALHFEMPKVNNEVTEDLTPDQLQNLLGVLDAYRDQQIANLMRLALYSGMRRGELLRLKWEHVDFQRGFISIVGPKGGKDQKIPLNDAARALLESHPRTGSAFVFPGRNGEQRTDCKRAVATIARKAGLPPGFRPLHGLRHVFASTLASSGQVDMHVLQRLLTHKSPSMTQRYAHLRDEALQRAAEVASEAFATSKLRVVKGGSK